MLCFKNPCPCPQIHPSLIDCYFGPDMSRMACQKVERWAWWLDGAVSKPRTRPQTKGSELRPRRWGAGRLYRPPRGADSGAPSARLSGLVPAQLAPQALSDPHPEASNSPADKPPREGFFFFCASRRKRRRRFLDSSGSTGGRGPRL